MPDTREINCFDYVNAGYERVRDVLQTNPLALCHSATKTTAAPGGLATAELHMGLGGFAIGTDVDVAVREVEEQAATPRHPTTTTLRFDWQASGRPWLFPFMHAELRAYPINATNTQLELVGRYDPPLGAIGAAVDAVIGHRIASACVDRFLADVAGHLRATLPGDPRLQ
jgi:hypothetical protein